MQLPQGSDEVFAHEYVDERDWYEGEHEVGSCDRYNHKGNQDLKEVGEELLEGLWCRVFDHAYVAVEAVEYSAAWS